MKQFVTVYTYMIKKDGRPSKRKMVLAHFAIASHAYQFEAMVRQNHPTWTTWSVECKVN